MPFEFVYEIALFLWLGVFHVVVVVVAVFREWLPPP